LPKEFENYIDEDFAVSDLIVVVGSSMVVKPFCGSVGRAPHYVPQIFVNLNENLTHCFDC
jgi:NAD-dependent SIR2 family protein deacetylase